MPGVPLAMFSLSLPPFPSSCLFSPCPPSHSSPCSALCALHGQLPSAYSKQILIMCNCPNATSERLMFANDIFAANEHCFYYHYCHSSTANVAQRAILIPERSAEGKIVKASLRFPFGKNLPHTFASDKLLAWGIQWYFALSGVFLVHPTLIFLSFMVLETNKF